MYYYEFAIILIMQQIGYFSVFWWKISWIVEEKSTKERWHQPISRSTEHTMERSIEAAAF